jgi:hypothetical protein
LSSIAPTVAALLLLPVHEFGVFAFLYAVFAFGWSVCLSVVCDTFLRAVGDRITWAEFSSVLVGFSSLVAVTALGVSLFIYPDVLSALSASGAIALGVYRLGARFFRSLTFGAASVLWAEVCNLLFFLAPLFGAMAIGVINLTSHSVAWLIAGIASISISPPLLSNPFRALLGWCRLRWGTIRMLLSDSLLMDCGAIIGPLLLLPGLGTQGFGIYRGVSSVASPVQLVLEPIRPLLAHMGDARRTGLKLLLGVVGSGLVMSIACFVVLLSLDRFDLVQGTLEALTAFAVPCSIFVFSNFLGHFYYLLNRAHSPAKRIRAGRFVQTVLVVGCPLLGAALFGLPGAIWGFVGATLVSSTTWVSLMLAPN